MLTAPLLTLPSGERCASDSLSGVDWVPLTLHKRRLVNTIYFVCRSGLPAGGRSDCLILPDDDRCLEDDMRNYCKLHTVYKDRLGYVKKFYKYMEEKRWTEVEVGMSW